MKLFEYQVREVFSEHGIPIPKGALATTTTSFAEAIDQVGLPCVLKSQVLHGGRGKAGLIRFATTRNEAQDQGSELLDRSGVHSVLVSEMVRIERELYLSVTIDPVSARYVVIASADGGVEIEVLAVERPEAIIRSTFDAERGLEDFRIKQIGYRLGLSNELLKQFVPILRGLYTIFEHYDAELVEINPLFITKDGTLVAGDAKLVIDDNALYRQKRFPLTHDYFSNDAEYEAAIEGIPYLQFDGDISLMCAGAGLTTVVYDLVNYAGGTIANYLEFGGPNYHKAHKAMELCLKNPSKVILVVTFGTIARADVMAKGLVDAMQSLQPDRPIVACIRGTGEEAAVELLKEAGLEPFFDTERAVQRAVELAKGVKS